MAEPTKKAEKPVYPDFTGRNLLPQFPAESTTLPPGMLSTEDAHKQTQEAVDFILKATETESSVVSPQSAKRLTDLVVGPDAPPDHANAAKQVENRGVYNQTLANIRVRWKEIMTKQALEELDELSANIPIEGGQEYIKHPEFKRKAQQISDKIRALPEGKSTSELLLSLWAGSGLDEAHIRLTAKQLDAGLRKVTATADGELIKTLAVPATDPGSNSSAFVQRKLSYDATVQKIPRYIKLSDIVSKEDEDKLESAIIKLATKSRHIPFTDPDSLKSFSLRAAEGLLMNKVDKTQQDMTTLLLDWTKEAYNNIKADLIGGNKTQQVEFTKQMEASYGKDWPQKLALWMAKESAALVEAVMIMRGGKASLAKTGLYKPLMLDKMYSQQAGKAAQALGKVLYWAVEGMAFAITHNVMTAPLEAYTKGGRWPDSINQTQQDMLTYTAGNIGFGATFLGLKYMARPVFDAVSKTWTKVAADFVQTERSRLGEAFWFNSTERLAIMQDDPVKAKALAVAADKYAWGEKDIMMGITGPTSPVGSPLSGWLKLAEETGAIPSNKSLYTPSSPSELISVAGLVESNEISTAVMAVNWAKIENRHSITAGTMPGKDGTTRYVFDANPGMDVYLTPVETTLEKAFHEAGPSGIARWVMQPKQWNKSAKEIQEARNRLRLAGDVAFKTDLKELNSIYKKANENFSLEGYASSQPYASKANFDRALLASNELNKTFSEADLMIKFDLTPVQVRGYKKLMAFADKIWHKENSRDALRAQKAGAKFILDGKGGLDGKGQYGKADIHSPNNPAKLTNEQLLINPEIKKAVEDWTADNKLWFESQFGASFDPLTRADHPITRIRNGEKLVKVTDLSDPGNYVVQNSKDYRFVKPEELIEPVTGEGAIPVINKRDGYFPIEYAKNNYLVTTVNPKTNEVNYIYGSRYGYSAERFVRQNKEAYKAKGLELVQVGLGASNHAYVVHPIDLLASGNPVSETTMRNFMATLKQVVPDMSQEQQSNLWDAFVRVQINPKMQLRGDGGLEGIGGRVVVKEGKDGAITFITDPTKRAIKSAEEAWHIRLSHLYDQIGKGSYRQEMASIFEAQFKPWIENTGGKWYSHIPTPNELGRGAEPNAWPEWRNAVAVQALLFRQFGTLSPGEKVWNQMAHTLAANRTSASLESKTTVGRLSNQMLSAIAEEGADVQHLISNFKKFAAAQIFIGNIATTIQQSVPIALATFRSPMQSTKFIPQSVALASTYFPGLKQPLMKSKFISTIRGELDRIGYLDDMKGISEYGSKGTEHFDTVAFATLFMGEAPSRIVSFMAAREEMHALWAKKTPEGLKWFSKDGKKLSNSGLNAVLSKAQDNNINFNSEDAPKLGLGFAGLAGQFVINPVLNLGGQLVWGNQYTKMQKLRMAIGTGLLFGTGAIYGLEDSMRAVAQAYDLFDSSPIKSKAMVDRVKLDIAQYTADQFNMDLEESKKFWKVAFGGVSGITSEDNELEYNATKRLFMGNVFHDSASRFGTDMLNAIPFIGAISKDIKGAKAIWDHLDWMRQELGEEGLLNREATKLRKGQIQEVIAAGTDRMLHQSVQGFPGIQRLIVAAYASGLNAEAEAKWWDSKGRAENEIQDKIGFGDYLSIFTGYKKDYGGALQDLNTLTRDQGLWIKAKALEGLTMSRVGRAALDKHNEAVANKLESSGISDLGLELYYRTLTSYTQSSESATKARTFFRIIGTHQQRRNATGSDAAWDITLKILED